MRRSGPDRVRRHGAGAALAAMVLASAMSAACGRTASAPEARPPVRPTYDPATGRLTGLAVDADGDARFEVTAHMDGRTLRRVDVDENGDGTPERREHYTVPSAAGTRAEPQLSLLEQFDASGALRRREGYDAGELTWAEEDRDLDGEMDRQETWVRGALTSVTIARPGSEAPLRILYPAPSAPAAVDRPTAGRVTTHDGSSARVPADGATPTD